MNRMETFQQFLGTQSFQVPLPAFVINLVLTAILAYILGKVYVRYGTSLSNRQVFARNFVLITMTTMLIITIVKSSLALSLGLVGALSIVRFRAAIKEPEELAYLFLAIAVGLGFGADQRVITVVAFLTICLFIMLRNIKHSTTQDNKNLYLSIASNPGAKLHLDSIVDVLKKSCARVELKRFDEAKDSLEADFLVELTDFEQLNKTKTALQGLSNEMRITFLDNKGII